MKLDMSYQKGGKFSLFIFIFAAVTLDVYRCHPSDLLYSTCKSLSASLAETELSNISSSKVRIWTGFSKLFSTKPTSESSCQIKHSCFGSKLLKAERQTEEKNGWPSSVLHWRKLHMSVISLLNSSGSR